MIIDARSQTMMAESRYKELLRDSILGQWEKFEYYRILCKRKGKTIQDLLKAIDYEEYYEIPAVVSVAFKKSRGLVHELNDLSVKGKFQVSSSTSGDPSHVYTSHNELNKIKNNYRRLADAFPGSYIHYAVKANNHPVVIAFLMELGASFEVASYQEICILTGAGVPSTRIIFSAPMKLPKHIKDASRMGVDRFVFDSQDELYKLARLAPGS